MLIVIICLLIFFGVPLPLKIAIFGINLFVPDPLPYVDEIIMALGLFFRA